MNKWMPNADRRGGETVGPEMSRHQAFDQAFFLFLLVLVGKVGTMPIFLGRADKTVRRLYCTFGGR